MSSEDVTEGTGEHAVIACCISFLLLFYKTWTDEIIIKISRFVTSCVVRIWDCENLRDLF